MLAVNAEDVLSSAAGRWRRIDSLLPDPRPSADDAGCGAELAVPAANGRAEAVGWCRHRQIEPEAAELTWGAAGQFWLTARVAGDAAEPGIGAALDELLVRWHAHLAAEPAAAGQDTQAAARWPSRDIGGVRALLRHGLLPLTVIAARPAGRAMPDARPAPGGLRIRPAGPGDVAAVTALILELVRFDQHFGSVLLHPHAGAGVGTALVAGLHQRLDAAGVAVTLLHHGQLNPLSAPFWSRMGYRPLWTSWQVRPADALR